MTKTFIEEYPGTILEATGLSHEIITKAIKDKSLSKNDNDSDEYIKFYDAYVVCGIPLKDIPEEIGIDERSCSAWASDIVPTIKDRYGMYAVETVSTNGMGMDIYTYAEKMDADYYDFHTGYTYLVRQYNRARMFGLPTPGIAVAYNGEIIGYARKLDD